MLTTDAARCAGCVSGLCWSTDSELLAVTVEQGDRRLLQLWQRRNWHWYLKKERRFAMKQVSLASAADYLLPPVKAPLTSFTWPMARRAR